MQMQTRYEMYLIGIVFIGLFVLYNSLNKEYEGFLAYQPTPTTMKHLYPRDPKTIQTIVNSVPLVVYQSWGYRKIPYYMQETIEANMKLNSEFDFYIFSDEDCRKFIEDNYENDVTIAFNTLKPGAYKSDLWRYCILYKKGGIYMDIKMKCVQPLVTLVRRYPVLFVNDRPMNNISNGIWNGFMISTPENPIFKRCISEIVENCRMKLYKRNPLDITGPHLLGRIADNSPNRLGSRVAYLAHKSNAKTQEVEVNLLSDDSTIIDEYPEYRAEQKEYQRSAHYSKLYYERKVYV